MRIRYYDWSGITLQRGNVLVGVDLFGEAVTWDALGADQTILLCVTHGHPEHAGSLRAFLSSPEAQAHLDRVHLISSPDVIAYINREGILASTNIHAIRAGERAAVDSVTVTAFRWVHMPLLPPGLRPKITYGLQLATHPLALGRIGLLGLRMPLNAPQIGFHIAFPDGMTALNYAEGLHRLTDPGEVEQVARCLPADVLCFAVEPDDVKAIPRWVEMLTPKAVYLYEAHRPWRNVFRLPFVDLTNYARELSAQFPSITFSALTVAGQEVAHLD